MPCCEHSTLLFFHVQEGWGPELSDEAKTEEWQKRMREVQGAIIVASLFQLIVGYGGEYIKTHVSGFI